MARILGAVVVIAANAGGAWTPIGDVTTTMLWIHGHISTFSTIKVLLLKFQFKLTKELEYANNGDFTFFFFLFRTFFYLQRFVLLFHWLSCH